MLGIRIKASRQNFTPNKLVWRLIMWCETVTCYLWEGTKKSSLPGKVTTLCKYHVGYEKYDTTPGIILKPARTSAILTFSFVETDIEWGFTYGPYLSHSVQISHFVKINLEGLFIILSYVYVNLLGTEVGWVIVFCWLVRKLWRHAETLATSCLCTVI